MKVLLPLGLLACLTVTASGTSLFTNGSFETGDLTGWTAVNNTGYGFTVTSGTVSPVSGNPTVGASNGTYYAVADDYAAGLDALVQAFTVPLGADGIIISFDVFVTDFGGGGGPGGEVDLLDGSADPLTGTALQVLYGPADTTSVNGYPTPYTSVSVYLPGVTDGSTYQIRVLNNEVNGPILVGADNFDAEAVPEPSLLLPVGAAMGLLAYRMRRNGGNV